MKKIKSILKIIIPLIASFGFGYSFPEEEHVFLHHNIFNHGITDSRGISMGNTSIVSAIGSNSICSSLFQTPGAGEIAMQILGSKWIDQLNDLKPWEKPLQRFLQCFLKLFVHVFF